ncbi:hypothetical protein ACS0TY_018701 [Phlomoides rotata]
MASLHKLLSEDGFQRRKANKKVKFKSTKDPDHSIALPIYICHDRRSFESSRQRADKARSLKGSSVFSSSRKDGSGSTTPRRVEPAIDDVAIRAVIGILSGYVGQYLRDKNFRLSMREKCRSCFKKGSNNEVLAHMELGIQSIEKMAVEMSNSVSKTEETENMDLESLQKSIKIMKIVASLDSDSSNTLSASAHLYLSIIYKIAKNDKISARHLLQVFSDSPFLARKHLLVELWDHFFLPHLLHLKIWYHKELDFFANSGYSDKERRIKALNQQYNQHMNIGTTLFANYYKEWLKVGAQAPPVPIVPLPVKSTYSRPRRKSTESSTSNHSASSKSLYQAVFGKEDGSSRNLWDLDADAEEDFKITNQVEKKSVHHHRRSSSQSYRTQKSSELWQDNQKPDYFGFLGCRSESITRSYIPSSNDKIKNDEDIHHLFEMNGPDSAISTVCSSQSLIECEAAVRTIADAWLNSHDIEASLSRASFIQGILEVLYVSNDDEVLELATSILAEIASRNEANRQCILSADPHLDVATRLMRSNTLFLKAAALLYTMKPNAEQMVSTEWIPLVLRVLEFGDQLQILFTVRCSPYDAAYYFLNQLLTGYDEDQNLGNARQLVSLGGLSLLVKRMEMGDTLEKCKAASVLRFCIRADGSCRHYLVKNLKKESVLSLLVLEKQSSSRGHSLELVTELLCLSRRNQRIEYLTGLAKGWNGINALQILLLRLQRARPEERPVAAVLLLQLDLIMGDPFEHSVYREEAIDAIVKALDCWVFDEKTQEQSARALLILGGYFSYTGEPEIEKCLLRKAGFQENTNNSFYGHFNSNDEDKTSENWEKKTAIVLLKSGNRRLLSVLSDSIGNSIPCLARASLVTVCWVSSYLHSTGDTDLQLASCSILVPQLTDILTHETSNLRDKILASFSLHNLIKGTDYLSATGRLQEEVLSCLEKLSLVTWTAKELISHVTTNKMDQFL